MRCRSGLNPFAGIFDFHDRPISARLISLAGQTHLDAAFPFVAGIASAALRIRFSRACRTFVHPRAELTSQCLSGSRAVDRRGVRGSGYSNSIPLSKQRPQFVRAVADQRRTKPHPVAEVGGERSLEMM